MVTLKFLKAWAKEEGVIDFSRVSKDELEELWESSQPEEPRKYNSLQPKRKAKQKTVIDKQFKFNAPILTPEKKKFKNMKCQKS